MTHPTLRWTIAFAVLLIAFSPATACDGGPAATATDPEEGPIRVGFLVLEGVYNSQLIAPYDIFHHTVFHTKPGMEVFTVGRRKGPVRTFEGLEITVEHDLENAPPIDVLVVPSAEHNMDSDLEDTRLIDWVRARGAAARHTISICDGAFLLAEAGLLDERYCTTFPGDIDAFRKRYPHLAVVDGVRFVADGPMITGVGGARSYDPAMFLVDHLYGPAVARGVGRGMVLDWDRETVRHLAIRMEDRDAPLPTCYLPGQRIDRDVVVEEAAGRAVRLSDLPAGREGVEAVVLTILAGAEAEPVAERGGFWCEDTFSEIPNLRHLRLNYGPKGVLFVGVLCPPVHHEAQFGYETGAFLERAESDPVYRRNRKRFVEASRSLEERGALPFDVVLFDPRFRLLASSPETTSAASWHGRFKWFEDSQTYGTPTTWILTRDLEVPTAPFSMNVYETGGGKLRYTVRDVAAALDRVLAGRGKP